MAQLVERVLGKDEVTGSNPVSSSIKPSNHGRFFFIQQQPRVGTRGCQKPPAMLVANSFSFKPTICYTKKLLRAKLYVRLANVHK